MLARAAFHQQSITFRLTALYTASALVILLGTTSVLYWALARDLRSEDARLLVTKAGELRQVAQRFPDRPEMLEEEVVFEPAAPRLEPYFARVVNADNGTVLESVGMARLLPTALFVVPSAGGRSTQPVLWRSPQGRTFLLYEAPLARSSTDGRRLQFALDVTHDILVLAGYRRVLLAVILLGTFLSGAAGYLIARRGLRPIGRITAAAKDVSATHLDQRIAGGPWPAELAELATVFEGMLRRLEDSFGRLSRFAADLAHELRTPLTNLRGEAEVALSRVRSPEEYRRVIESALEEYGRLADLVDRLLFLARAEAGAVAVERQCLDVGTVLEDVCDYYRPLADEAGVEVVCSGGGALCADSLLLRRAIGNLVDNAIEHTAAGGRVIISAEPTAGGTALFVADTGCGIEPEHLPRIFDRFYQVDPARERRHSGAGLGLALVRSIVELHGGSVQIESRIGRGTTLTLTLPR